MYFSFLFTFVCIVMFYVSQFRFVPSHRFLMWTSLLLLLHLIPAISMLNDTTTDMNVVQDLKDGKRGFIVMGVLKSRLVVVVGNVASSNSKVVGQSRFKRQSIVSAKVPADDFYVFDMSVNSFTADNKLYLHNGTLFKDKWPHLYDWWQQPREVELQYNFIISDEQHGYLVAIDKYGHAFSYVIDPSPGDKVMTNKREVNLYFTWLSSSEPMCAFYRQILANDYEQPTTRPPSLGQLGGPNDSVYSNFHICKTTFKGSSSLPEANWSDDDGGVYLCKANDGQIMTQTYKCTTPLDWDLLGGFVDGDRVVVFDTSGSNMHVFPKSALERSNANKTVKVNDIPKTDFVIAGEPPADSGLSGHSWVIGLVVLFLVIAIVAFVVFYFCCVKSESPAKAGGSPGGGGGRRSIPYVKTPVPNKGNSGKQSRQGGGGSSSKGQSSARHTKKRANSFKTSNTTPKGASSRKLKQKHSRGGSPSKTSHNSKNSKRSKRNRTGQQNSSKKVNNKNRSSKSNKK